METQDPTQASNLMVTEDETGRTALGIRATACHLLENDGRLGREITVTVTYLLDRLHHKTTLMDGTAPNTPIRTGTEIETDLPEAGFEEAIAMQRPSIPTFRATIGSGTEEEADGNHHGMIDAVTTGTTVDDMTGGGVVSMTTGCDPAEQGVAVAHPFVTGTVTATVITGGARSPVVSRPAMTTGWEDIGHREPPTAKCNRCLLFLRGISGPFRKTKSLSATICRLASRSAWHLEEAKIKAHQNTSSG